MNQDALKFTDLDSFFKAAEGMGFNGSLKDLLYEQDRLPYCSAYLIPIDLLPASFDLTARSRFGGTLTRVEEIHYLGTEQFTTDFMIYPLSLTGYVEIDSCNPTTFAETNLDEDPEGNDMNFVINIEDGGGKEFYLTQLGNLIALTDHSDDEPQVFKSAKQVNKQIDLLRQKYSEACQVYALEQHEFDARRTNLLTD